MGSEPLTDGQLKAHLTYSFVWESFNHAAMMMQAQVYHVIENPTATRNQKVLSDAGLEFRDGNFYEVQDG